MGDVLNSVWSGSFELFGVDVQCHVLVSGQRIIEAESMERLIDAMARGAAIKPYELEAFSKWQAGMVPHDPPTGE